MKHPNRFLKYSDKNKQNTNFHKKGNSLDPNKEQKIDIDDCQTQLSNLITQLQKNTNSNNKIHYTSNEERLFSFSPNRIIKDKVLPPNNNNDKKTLVLDLDETLVHSAFNPFIPSSDIILKIKLDNNIHDIHVLIRPGVEEFINKMSQFYEIVIFTASLSKVLIYFYFFFSMLILYQILQIKIKNVLIDYLENIVLLLMEFLLKI